MLNCPSLKDRGWYSSPNVHSIHPPSLWSEGCRWSGCRQRRQSCKSYSADWAMSLTALVRNEYVCHSAYKRATWFGLNACRHWVAYWKFFPVVRIIHLLYITAVPQHNFICGHKFWSLHGPSIGQIITEMVFGTGALLLVWCCLIKIFSLTWNFIFKIFF